MYDSLADPKGPFLAGLRGPAGLMLHSPGLTPHAHNLNTYLRFESGIAPRLRELVILVTAREMDSQFEWAAHEAQAERDGLERSIIEIVKHRREARGLSETDAVVIELGRELISTRHVSPDLFARALAIFGPRQLVDLVALIGNYVSTALLLAAFDVQLRPGVAPPLLPLAR